jgi:hypothetical protein
MYRYSGAAAICFPYRYICIELSATFLPKFAKKNCYLYAMLLYTIVSCIEAKRTRIALYRGKEDTLRGHDGIEEHIEEHSI